MKKIVVVALLMTLFNCIHIKINEKVTTDFYVGTYTNGESKGIYQYQIDENGLLTNKGLMAEIVNPSFLAKTPDNTTLVAVSEVDENGTGFVHSYKIEKDTLVFVSKSKSGGAHPCFITVNNKNQVLVANYSGGNVGYLQIDDQNGLTNVLSLQQHVGKGTTSRQEAPHAHSTWFHPNKKDIISVDLGTNELWFSTIDDTKNELVFTNQKKLKMAEGAGPRHLTFHPNNRWIYVLNELNNTVSLVRNDGEKYVIDSSISLLPEGYEKYTKGADIHVTKDGKFVYASNRGHDSIVIFNVNQQNGVLTLVGFESVKGANPRNFSLTPDNRFLLVANQDTNNIVCFQRDFKTGKLTFVNQIAAPNPVCLLF